MNMLADSMTAPLHYLILSLAIVATSHADPQVVPDGSAAPILTVDEYEAARHGSGQQESHPDLVVPIESHVEPAPGRTLIDPGVPVDTTAPPAVDFFPGDEPVIADAVPVDTCDTCEADSTLVPSGTEDTCDCIDFAPWNGGDPLSSLISPSQTASRYPQVQLTGFFQVDALWSDFHRRAAGGTGALPFFFSIPDDRRGFRRARLAAIGQVADNVGFMLEMDFAFPGRPTFMDLYMDIQKLPFGTLRVGQWRQPFGLGELTSVKSLTFHERASMFFLGPFRKTGIGIYNSNQRSTYALSLFGGSVANVPNQFGTSLGDSNFGWASRLTTLLVDQDRQLFHIGAGYSNVQLDRDDFSGFELNVPPEVVGPPVEFFFGSFGTSIGDSTQLHLFNSEFAAVNGPLHIESELRYAFFDRVSEDTVFPSFYAQVGYVLTGESRGYDRNNGVMGAVSPRRPFGHSGPGAWELAARYSHIDLNHDNVSGGKANNFLVGLNWYLNDYAKFQFNYLRSNYDTPGLENYTSVYAIRGQVAF